MSEDWSSAGLTCRILIRGGIRVQSDSKPLRIFYAFDPRRMAILLIGGDKTGDGRFYEQMIPIADELYDQHLAELAKEKNGGR